MTTKMNTISDIIAKSCGLDKPAFDPKLVKMFGKPKLKIHQVSDLGQRLQKPIAKSQDTTLLKGNQFVFKRAKNTEVPEAKLSHREAAAIRIEAKLKSKSSINVNRMDKIASDYSKAKVVKRSHASTSIEDGEDEAAMTMEPMPKNNKKKRNDQSVMQEHEDEDLIQDFKTTRNVEKTLRELNAPKEKDTELESRTVYVGNVPKEFQLKKSRLKKLFSPYGAVETIRFRGAAPAKPTLLKKVAFRRNELHPDSSSIVAYVRFKTRKEAKKAAKALNGFQVEEHYLTVDMADNKKRDNKKSVFVGNLHLKIHDNELRSYFEECGSIHAVRVVRDSATGMGKGFGYVNFENSDSVELALKLDGGELRSRPVRVKRAVKKEKIKRSQGERQRIRLNDSSSIPVPQKIANFSRSSPGSKIVAGKEKQTFTGDRLSEIGKLKRKQKKLNKGEMKKAHIVRQLTGVQPKKQFFQKKKLHHKTRPTK